MKKLLQKLTIGLIMTISSCSFTCQAVLNNTSTDLSNQLHQATEKNNLTQMKTLINQGVDINAFDEDGSSPLDIAIKMRNIDAVKLLLTNKNIDIEAKFYHNLTPIEYAQRLLSNIENWLNTQQMMIDSGLSSLTSSVQQDIASETQKKNMLQAITELLFTHGAQYKKIILLNKIFSDAEAFDAQFKKDPQLAITKCPDDEILSLDRAFTTSIKSGDNKTLELFNKLTNEYNWKYALKTLALCSNITLLPKILYKTGHNKVENYTFLWDKKIELKTDGDLNQHLDSNNLLLATYSNAKKYNNISFGKAFIGAGVTFKTLHDTKNGVLRDLTPEIMSYLPAITSSTHVHDAKKKNLKRKINETQKLNKKKKK